MKNTTPTKAELHRSLYSRVGKSRLDLETQLLHSVMEFCAVSRIPCFRRNIGAMEYLDGRGKRRLVKFNATGMSDLWGTVEGKHWECELKAPGKKPSDEQDEWLKSMRKAECVAFWCDSLDGFISEMKKAGLL